jgi:hypothetical protein
MMKEKAVVLIKLRALLSPKWKAAAIFSLSFALPFMVFLFSPLDIYLHNPTAFVVGWRFLVPHLLVLLLICFLALSVMLLLLLHEKCLIGIALLTIGFMVFLFAWYALNMFQTALLYILSAFGIAAVSWVLLLKLLRDTAADVVLLVLWGVLAGAYVQVLFLNGEMGDITGGQPEYGVLTVTNLLIWGATALLPLFIWVLAKKMNREFKYEKALVFSVLIIAGMQVTGLVSTAASTELPEGYGSGPDDILVTSYEAATRFSEDENIIVFVIDRFDVICTREALEANPHFRGYLDGFTHYENNIAEFFDTLPSMVSMLTQSYYREEMTIFEYWEEAWSGHNVIDTLREHGFTTNLYLDYLTTYGSLEDIRGRTDNLKAADGIKVNTRGFLGTITRLALGRLSPYRLKNMFLRPVNPAFGNELFFVAGVDRRMVQPPVVSLASDLHFLEFLEHHELSDFTSESGLRVFNVMHLNGAHGLFKNIEGLVTTFEILFVYFDMMKEAGVYDNSTIILIGDHGFHWHIACGLVPEDDPGFDFQRQIDPATGWAIPTTTSLMIKPKGARGELTANSEAELSNKYFAASILELAGLPHYELGFSFFDIIGGAEPPKTRTIHALHSWINTLEMLEEGGSGRIAVYGKYEVSGNALDIGNWVFIEAP